MVATVSAAGAVTARTAGPATIRARSEGREGSVTIGVRAVRPGVAAVRIYAVEQLTLATAASFQLNASAVAANDSILDDRVITWSSSNESVASVSSSGLVTATGAGEAWITAASEGKDSRATVTVNAPAACDWSPRPTAW